MFHHHFPVYENRVYFFVRHYIQLGTKKSTFGKTQLGGGGEKSRSPSSEKMFPIGFFEEKATNTIITTSASFGSFLHISCFFGYLSKKTDFQCHGFKKFQFISPKNKKSQSSVLESPLRVLSRYVTI